jgi:guanidinopropionase
MPKEPLKPVGGETIAPFTYPDTLLRAQRQQGPEGLDIALFGLPFDGGTIARDGARHGPGQMRQMSINIRGTNMATGASPFATCRIADIGDAPVNSFDHVQSVDKMTAFCAKVAEAGAWPLAAGGDHLITLPVLRGTVDPKHPVGLVHFDAHPDTHDAIFGTRLNHATPFRRAIEEGLVDPKRHVMIGLRGTTRETDAAIDWARDQGITMIDADMFFDLGAKAVAEKAREVVGTGPVYVTLDVDGVDPADMPGTGSPEPGGMRMRDMQVILRGLRGLDIVGGDVNEVSPPLDPTGYTAFNAVHLMFEILCLMGENRVAKGL